MQKYCYKILQYYPFIVNCLFCDLRLRQDMDLTLEISQWRGSGGAQARQNQGNTKSGLCEDATHQFQMAQEDVCTSRCGWLSYIALPSTTGVLAGCGMPFFSATISAMMDRAISAGVLLPM